MSRNFIFRRGIVAIFIFTALFSQFQTVYACGLDGKVRYFCCCHKHDSMHHKNGAMDGHGSMKTMDCDMDGQCYPQQDMSAQGCCDISYEQAPGATGITPGAQAQQVLLLDAPQPPPAVLLDPPDPPLPGGFRAGIDYFPIPPWSSGTWTYLLTGRLRI